MPTPFGFFEFALVGVPLLAGTVVIVVMFGNRLLPHRNARYMPADFSEQARVLLAHYELDHQLDGQLFSRQSGVAEVIVRPRSGLIGEPAFPGMITESGDLVVLAVHRNGEDLGPKEVSLAAGDVMLLKGTWDALAVNLEDPDVLVVDEPRIVRRQAVPLGPGAKRTLAIVAVMVVLLATGAVPAAVAGLLAAGALILTRVMSIEHAYRGINWTTIVLVAGMIPLSTAMQSSGAADQVADGLLDVVGGPYTVADRPVRRHCCARSADQQHGHGADRHPGGDRRGNGARCLRAASADVRHGDLIGRPADTGGHPCQPDGDGSGWLSLRRLCQARLAPARLVLRGWRRACAGVLELLT